jgi:hypothetical protein
MIDPLETDDEDYDPQAVELLEKIKAVRQRPEQRAQHGRAVFLEQARSIKATLPARHPELTSVRSSLLGRKRLFGLSPLVTILIVVALILGSTSTTVYAAQSSTPDHFLYPVKIASEDLRLSLAASSNDKVNMDIEFANRRLQEASLLTESEKYVPNVVSTRWGRHLDDVFEYSQQLDDSQMRAILTQLQAGLQQQLQTSSQLVNAHPEDEQLARLHAEIQAGIYLVESGLANPTALRQQIKAAGGTEIEHEMESVEDQKGNSQSAPVSTPNASKSATSQANSTPAPLLNENTESETPEHVATSPAPNSVESEPKITPQNSGENEQKSSTQNSSESEHKSPTQTSGESENKSQPKTGVTESSASSQPSPDHESGGD